MTDPRFLKGKIKVRMWIHADWNEHQTQPAQMQSVLQVASMTKQPELPALPTNINVDSLIYVHYTYSLHNWLLLSITNDNKAVNIIIKIC